MKRKNDRRGNLARNARLAEEIHKSVAKFLTLNLRGLKAGLVTVTYVDLSHDYKSAKIFVTQFSDIEIPIDTTLVHLNDRVSDIKKYLTTNLRLRVIPDLKFFHDQSIQRGSYISALIDDVSLKNTE